MGANELRLPDHNMLVIVPLVVAVHLNGNVTVGVIGTVGVATARR
jgi:hypothetical protein